MSNKKHILQCTQAYKSFSTHANHEQQTLLNSSYNISEVDFRLIKPLSAPEQSKTIEAPDSLVRQKIGLNDKHRPSKRMYTLYARMNAMHACQTPAQAQWKGQHRKELDRFTLSHAFNDIRSYFDITEDSPSIDHCEWTFEGIYLMDCEQAQQACKKVLNKHIHGKWVLFHKEQGWNRTWHFHTMSQGYIDSRKKVGYISGWAYNKEKNDRKPYQDFKRTLNYCLCKVHENKKSYIKR